MLLRICKKIEIDKSKLSEIDKNIKVGYFTDTHSFTVDNLMQLCNFVQLIENPTFLSLRMDLLEPDKNRYLIKALQIILMMLPIGKAFTALKTRLECIKLDPML